MVESGPLTPGQVKRSCVVGLAREVLMMEMIRISKTALLFCLRRACQCSMFVKAFIFLMGLGCSLALIFRKDDFWCDVIGLNLFIFVVVFKWTQFRLNLCPEMMVFGVVCNRFELIYFYCS
ncbi:hypothetical protein QQ045_032532 [Rhodiola kirilowii]